jgi:hypothetical protein
LGCPYCKAEIIVQDIFCPSCDSRLYSPQDFLQMKELSPLASILKWIESYRSGNYTLGQFQTRLIWLIEAVKLQKTQIEHMVLPKDLPEPALKSKEAFIEILGLMLEALERADEHLRKGEDELLKQSLVTIHEVHNRLHNLKEAMEENFSQEELKSS